MWLVRIALKRPYTFVVLAMLIVIMGVVTLASMATDMLPEIDIPVIAVINTYTGLSPEEMTDRITTQLERATTTTVSGIEHIESQSLNGVSVTKIFLQPGASVDAAIAEVTSEAQAILKTFPPGATAPLIMRYSASNVPVLQAVLTSDILTEQQLFDLGTNFFRTGLATVQGAQVPLPVGGKQREIVVDLDLQKLFALGLSPSDVSNAVNVENLVAPSGTVKLGRQEYPLLVNASPEVVDELNNLPIKTVNGATVFIKDVAHVRDGFAPQRSVVLADGRKAAMLPILKSQGSSTLAVVDGVRAAVPGILATLPRSLKTALIFDQSVFVRAAVSGVLREALIAAGLTGLMMLLFLGSWRSTLIVLVSIPLSLLVAVTVLHMLGQTLNLMTLGGMALSVGILVDDATVTIENVHRHASMNKGLVQAILDGAQEIAAPAFVSTLCICIVFVPIYFISGSARSLFVPLAMAVVIPMLTSYFLSRSLVPTMMQFLLGKETAPGAHEERPRWAVAFERGFDRLLAAYGRTLQKALANRPLVIGLGLVLAVGSAGLFPLLGKDFFPAVDAGQLRLHVRGPAGMRIEETQNLFARVEERIHKVIPATELDSTLDDIGVPVSGINLTLGDPSMISTADGEILVSLKANHQPTANYVRALRSDLQASFPQVTFFFLPADITSQTLNFGLSAPIDVQITGPTANQPQNLVIADELVRQISAAPGAVDVHRAQVVDTPSLKVDVDRTLSNQVGLTQRAVADDLLISLSSSGQTAPNYWLDPKSGVQYLVAVQTPQYRVDSLDALNTTPLSATTAGQQQLLSNVATISRISTPTNITHYNVSPTYDVQANVDGTDLGSVSSAISKIVKNIERKLPRGTTIKVIGQVQSMNASFNGLELGLLFAVLLVYLLMVVNFQSWLDPFIILTALPGAIAGIAWMLFLTGTRLSVPALMGAMMTVGVATSNSILMVVFANERRAEGIGAPEAALLAGKTRLRPVTMTALAMSVGMVPMALSLGEGGEQNAPLGRAVIGGLLLATLSTLFFVPAMYSVLRGGRSK
ncbi:MAG TPA: efflux RND transporter permease subunit [Myxococcaceae bacterium]|nr:efflux RND transporter permease subunit [Myxococcaceae bacterium]